MSDSFKITASVVLYNNKPEEVERIVQSCVTSPLIKTLFIVDNSQSNILKSLATHPKIRHQYLGENPGFGRGHNTILQSLDSSSDLHLILNPDVWFNPEVIEGLTVPFLKIPTLSLLAPKLLFPNGKTQISSRRSPNIFNLLVRFLNLHKKENYKGEETEQVSECYETQFLHGAFLLIRTSDFLELKGFDNRYFLYMEDADLSRSLLAKGKQICYYPKITAYHTLKRGSKSNFFLFFQHIVSVFRYFFKWGLT